jgi:BirA family biotin operon repressor/biotin-[acetyl-CoA-carboxylase] ligase
MDTDRLIRETLVARVEHHTTLGSTNDRARRCAAEGAGPLPLLVVADCQTAGRGRGGNRWWTGRGSLACSLLLEVDAREIERGRSPLVALAAAVAIVRTAAPLLAPRSVGVHWPNDVFVDGRKLAGVLVEGLSDRLYVLGIGLNTNNTLEEAPRELRAKVATLRELTGIRHDRTTILSTLLGHLGDLLEELGPAPQRIAEWADTLCLQRGRVLTVRTGGRSVSGRCQGIAPDGALLLETDRGRESIYSGVLI